MSDLRMLVVEDEALIYLDLKDRLEEAGYAVAAGADNAEEALAAVAQHRPDLVFMDIRIKGEHDGIWTADQIRMRFDIPVIFLTAHADDTTIHRAKMSGPYGYIVKPFNGVNFQSQIETVIWKHAEERKVRLQNLWLESTLLHVADGLIATDAFGAVVLMNPEAERLTGMQSHEATGMKLLEVLTIYDGGTGMPMVTPLHTVFEGNDPSSEPFTCVLQGDRVDGAHAIDVRMTVHRDDTGFIGLIVGFRDVTEVRQKTSREQQKDRMHAVSTLAAGFAQQLEKSLKVVEMQAQRLLKNAPEELQPDVKGTWRGVLSIQMLVQELHELGSRRLRAPEPFDLNSVVRAITTERRSTMQGKWTYNLDLTEDPLLISSDRQLCQRNLNRLLNVVRMGLPRGGVIDISSRHRDIRSGQGEAVLTVHYDKTPKRTMPSESIFDPYPSHIRTQSSIGLSLALLYHFVGLSGGTVDYETSPERGSVLTMVFPAYHVVLGTRPATSIGMATIGA